MGFSATFGDGGGDLGAVLPPPPPICVPAPEASGTAEPCPGGPASPGSCRGSAAGRRGGSSYIVRDPGQ
jgi:hypothetical protein